jgi:CelD/BcsL family acetyltransferase involved in cellulose biosynthesis
MSDLSSEIEGEWRALLDRSERSGMAHDPDWLRMEFRERLADTHVLLVYEGDHAIGLLTFLIKRWPLYIRAGEVKAATIPLTRLCVLDAPLVPDSQELYDRIFQELSDAKELGFDVIYLEVVSESSFLHRWLATSATAKDRFRDYRPQGTMEHHRLNFPDTLEQYWEGFSSKTRSTMRRKVKKLAKDTGKEVTLERYTDRDLEKYARDTHAISQRSYQYHLLGQGIQDREAFLARCKEAASHGWLRGYVLHLGGEPIAFMHGWQYRGVYLYLETAYDQELRSHSPGTVLHIMVIEDMFEHDTPKVFEFGVHGDQKATFGNASHRAAEVFLIRPSAYPMVATGLYRLSNAGTEAAKKVLDRYGVKDKVKQMMRRLSVR